MENNNVAVVRQFFELFAGGDLESIKELLAPDFEWIYHGPESVPWAGVYRGEKGFDRFFEIVHELLDVRKCDPYEFIDGSDKVVVLGVSHTRIKANDAMYEARWVNVFTVENGLIKHYYDLFDTGSVLEALRA